MESSAAKIARSSLIFMSGDASKLVINVLALAYFARALSLTEMGTVVGLTILLGSLQLVADPGLGGALITYTAEGIGKKQNIRPLIRKIIMVGVGLGAALAFLLLLGGNFLSSYILKTSISENLLRILAVDMFLTCLGPYIDGSFEGLRDFKNLTIAKTVKTFARQLGGIAFIAFGLGVMGVVIGWVLGDAIYVVQSLTSIERTSRPYSKLPPTSPSTKELLKFAVPLFGSDLITYVSEWFDQIFVLAVLPLEQLALYNVAFSIFDFAGRFPGAIAETLLPHYAEKFGKAGVSALQTENRKATRYVSILFTPLALGLAAISTSAISLIAGPKYASGSIILVAFCVSAGLIIWSIGFDEILYVLKKTRTLASFQVLAAISGLLLGITFVRPFGVFGVALARSINIVFIGVLEFYVLRRLISLSLDGRTLAKTFLCGVIMAAAVFAVEVAFISIDLIGVYITIGAVVYLLLIAKAGILQARDFDLVRELLGPKISPAIDKIEKLVLPHSN